MKNIIIVCFILCLLVVSVSGVTYDEYLSIIGAEQSQDSYDYYVSNNFAEKSDSDIRNLFGVGLSSIGDSYIPIDLPIPKEIDPSPDVSIQNIPTSGSAYSDPVMTSVEYAEAESGSLLSILYSLFGRPVRAYHYRYQTNSQGTYSYAIQTLDYDVNWMSSVVVFLLVLWCVFKLGGVLLSKT